MAEGEFARVRQHLEQALPKPAVPPGNVAPGGDHDLYAMLADACAQQRDLNGLRQYAPLAEAAATRYGHKLYEAMAHRAFGVILRLEGAFAESQARLFRALELFGQLGAAWQTGRTLLELGELAWQRMDTSKARDYFSRALAAFESRHASADVERARTAMQMLDTIA